MHVYEVVWLRPTILITERVWPASRRSVTINLRIPFNESTSRGIYDYRRSHESNGSDG